MNEDNLIYVGDKDLNTKFYLRVWLSDVEMNIAYSEMYEKQTKKPIAQKKRHKLHETVKGKFFVKYEHRYYLSEFEKNLY